MWGGGEYQHPLGERLWLQSGANIAQREYPGIAFDQTTLAVHVGPRWLTGDTTELSLLGSARRGWVAGETNHREHGIRLEVERHFTQRLTARVNSSWHQRKYFGNNLLDGPRFAFSLGGSWFMTPTVRTNATVGYRYERPKSLVWRNSSRWARFASPCCCLSVLRWASMAKRIGQIIRAGGTNSRQAACPVETVPGS